MAVPKRIHDAKGSWKGKSQLHLSYLPPEEQVTESTSSLIIDTDSRNKIATITYTWEHEGQKQEGTIVLGMDDETKAVEIGWVDSWHQNASVMHLVGTETESGAVHTKGSFPAGDEPWGWTIAFEYIGDQLTMTMEVVPPGEEPDWAVKAVYERG